jgi:hypothetical protein
MFFVWPDYSGGYGNDEMRMRVRGRRLRTASGCVPLTMDLDRKGGSASPRKIASSYYRAANNRRRQVPAVRGVDALL